MLKLKKIVSLILGLCLISSSISFAQDQPNEEIYELAEASVYTEDVNAFAASNSGTLPYDTNFNDCENLAETGFVRQSGSEWNLLESDGTKFLDGKHAQSITWGTDELSNYTVEFTFAFEEKNADIADPTVVAFQPSVNGNIQYTYNIDGVKYNDSGKGEYQCTLNKRDTIKIEIKDGVHNFYVKDGDEFVLVRTDNIVSSTKGKVKVNSWVSCPAGEDATAIRNNVRLRIYDVNIYATKTEPTTPDSPNTGELPYETSFAACETIQDTGVESENWIFNNEEKCLEGKHSQNFSWGTEQLTNYAVELEFEFVSNDSSINDIARVAIQPFVKRVGWQYVGYTYNYGGVKTDVLINGQQPKQIGDIMPTSTYKLGDGKKTIRIETYADNYKFYVKEDDKFVLIREDVIFDPEVKAGKFVLSNWIDAANADAETLKKIRDNIKLKVYSMKAEYMGENPDPFVQIQTVAANTIAENATYGIDLQISGHAPEVRKATFSLEYDPTIMEYIKNNSRYDEVELTHQDGRCDITYILPENKNIPYVNANKYSQNVLTRPEFKMKQVDHDKSAQIIVNHIQLFDKQGNVLNNIATTGSNYTLNVLDSNVLDFNGDGVIGAGDIALAPLEKKGDVADASNIYPYKRAMVITAGGVGRAFSPNAHYAGETTLENARSNEYALNLINEEFATSHTAKSVMPASSAQNYTSMFMGCDWNTLPMEYRMNNISVADYYHPDFGKETPQYPTMFHALRMQDPLRLISVFAQWDPLSHGMIEPDIGVNTQTGKNINYAEYAKELIAEPEFKKTGITYLQSNTMDEWGHENTWFDDAWYAKLKEFDGYYKDVIDALKTQELYDDTLIVLNSDHGGDGNQHEKETDACSDVFISVGGQTVNNGKTLEGGSNVDIAGLVLDSLRLKKPDTMSESGVFDSEMFLPQEKMIHKNRDVEKIVFNTAETTGTITLENNSSDIRVVEAKINLENKEVPVVTTKGTVLKNEIIDDKLKLVISFNEPITSDEIATLSFSKSVAETKIEEIMLGTATGSEVYCDLVNEYSGEEPLKGIKVLMDSETRTATILGRIDNTTSTDIVTIVVTNPTKSIDQIDYTNKNEVKTIFANIHQTNVDEQGKFSYSFGFDEVYGRYHVKVSEGDGDKITELSFVYGEELTESQIISQKINSNDVDTAEEIADILNKYRTSLKFDYISLQNIKNKNMIYSQILKAKPFVEPYDDFYLTINTGITLQRFNEISTPEELDRAISENLDRLGLKDNKRYQLFQEFYCLPENLLQKDVVLQDIIKSIGTNNIQGFSDFVSIFEKVIINNYITATTLSYLGIEQFLKSNNDLFKIDFTTYDSLENKKVVCDKMLSISYDDYANVKNNFDAFVSNQKQTESQGGSSGKVPGGSGGGGGGGNKNTGLGDASFIAPADPKLPEKPSVGFIDVPEDFWANKAITYMAEKNIVTGYENQFNPNENITRYEFIKILVNSFGLYNENAICHFADVEQEHWANKYVASGCELGLVNGYSETEFSGDSFITREEMATLVHRFAVYAGMKLELETEEMPDEEIAEEDIFQDQADISEFALSAVKELYHAGYINGIGDNLFSPHNSATRAEAVTIIYNVIVSK